MLGSLVIYNVHINIELSFFFGRKKFNNNHIHIKYQYHVQSWYLLRKQMTSLISPAYLLDMQILKNISGKTYLNRKLVVTLLSKSPCICLSGIEGLLLRSPIIMVLGKEDKSRIKMPASCIFSSSQLLIWDFKFAEKRKVFHAFNLYHKFIWIATFFGKKKAETYARNIFCLNLRLYVYKQRRQVQEPT